MIELAFLPRPAQHSRAKQILRENLIPFVLYAKGKDNLLGVVNKDDVSALLRNIQAGFLPTTKIRLKGPQGETRTVIVKEIQYKTTTYDVIHIDFLELVDTCKVTVKVPVELLNEVDCIGVKMGGFMRQVLRHVPVQCLPQDMPSHFPVDVVNLDIGQERRVRDLGISKNVRPLVKEGEVVVTIAKR